MKIVDIIKSNLPSISFEFFPPKNIDLEHILFDTIESLKEENANFASVTFGAFGSTSHKTLEWTKYIKSTCQIATMMHLTCVGFTKEKLDDIFKSLIDNNIHNILALRGDMPNDLSKNSIATDFRYASDMVSYIKKAGYDFCIGVAGYPETHPEAISPDSDIDMLKKKIDAGGDFIITQLFFDNDKFFMFRDKLARKGVNVPVVAGIMPILSSSQIINFTKKCHTSIPDKLLNQINNCNENEVIDIGINYAVKQCENLIKNGVDGLHFYTLNRSVATKTILDKLRNKGVI